MKTSFYIQVYRERPIRHLFILLFVELPCRLKGRKRGGITFNFIFKKQNFCGFRVAFFLCAIYHGRVWYLTYSYKSSLDKELHGESYQSSGQLAAERQTYILLLLYMDSLVLRNTNWTSFHLLKLFLLENKKIFFIKLLIPVFIIDRNS